MNDVVEVPPDANFVAPNEEFMVLQHDNDDGRPSRLYWVAGFASFVYHIGVFAIVAWTSTLSEAQRATLSGLRSIESVKLTSFFESDSPEQADAPSELLLKSEVFLESNERLPEQTEPLSPVSLEETPRLPAEIAIEKVAHDQIPLETTQSPLVIRPAATVDRKSLDEPPSLSQTKITPRRKKRSPATVSPPSPPAAQLPSVNAGVDESTPAEPINNPPPIFPDDARRRGIQGRVVLRAVLSLTGEVSKLTIAKSSGHAIFDEAAVRAVRSWRFTPARRYGMPVVWKIRIPIRFELP